MPLRIVTVKVEERVVELLDKVARMSGGSRSELIREAIYMYLKSRGVVISRSEVMVSRPKFHDRAPVIEVDV
ncbi:MAG TPA: CopG family transcriptional regulator [Pyrodictium sp.]|nr:CopG family transcriptional regulator [Pyrodictium sp.]